MATWNQANPPALTKRSRWYAPAIMSMLGSRVCDVSHVRFGCCAQSTLFMPLMSAPLGIGEFSLPGESESRRRPSAGSWYQSCSRMTRSVV